MIVNRARFSLSSANHDLSFSMLIVLTLKGEVRIFRRRGSGSHRNEENYSLVRELIFLLHGVKSVNCDINCALGSYN